MSFKALVKFQTALLSSAFLIASCGGGGGSSSSGGGSGGSGGGSTGPTWTAGQFANEDDFQNQCAAPRSGNDINGNPWPDRAGSTTLENFWLRSWSNDTYLWYNEITDQNPALFSDRLAYFNELKTTALTASGTPKDQFHFTVPTDEYEERVNAGTSAGYGARFVLIRSSAPREIKVGYVQPGSPAAGQLSRGTEILEVDGVDAINGGATDAELATLNNGLFPPNPGQQTTLLVRDAGATDTRTITLTSQTISEAPVQTSRVIDTPTGPVGYMHFTTFGIDAAERALFDTMTSFRSAGVNDLVLDLRYNGGGFLDIASGLSYMIAGSARTNGRIFDRLVFNNKYPNTNPVTGRTLTPTPFHTRGRNFSVSSGTNLPTLNLPRVFILTTSRTCSASEAVMNSLRGIDVEVIQIGGRTCGKPYGFYGRDNCGETYFTIQFRGENDKSFGDYADGFQASDAANLIGESVPGCELPDDFDTALGRSDEGLLAAALQYRADGTCPAAASSKSDPALGQLTYSNAKDLRDDPRLQMIEFLDTSRIENRRDVMVDVDRAMEQK